MRPCLCGCGVEFAPRRSDQRFATTTCRSRWFRANKARAAEDAEVAGANVVALAARRTKPAPASAPKAKAGGSEPGGVEAALLRELGDAANTSIGQQAIVLARRLDSNADGLSSMATASKQLTILTRAALMEKAPDAEQDMVGAVQAEVLEMRRRFADASA